MLIFSGAPTNPSSSFSGVTLIIFFAFVFIDMAFAPFLFIAFTISLLKSINTFSTMLIILLSVTLKPLINFVVMLDFSNSFLILGPPP